MSHARAIAICEAPLERRARAASAHACRSTPSPSVATCSGVRSGVRVARPVCCRRARTSGAQGASFVWARERAAAAAGSRCSSSAARCWSACRSHAARIRADAAVDTSRVVAPSPYRSRYSAAVIPCV
ncbi:hypothetical protein MPMin1_gp66 [Microbacterium phage Min1]|uniref:Uncharacterized protein n=1 Tax=Microbacterium phage Min1 TaxID=446529 RepID=A6N225_9CAUD|nr:hypothetical protein MPMin1_gp66 [Microbacterium phage Min1]ABR10496.1 hypothetical protein [Microbacterium phage Min1]